MLRLYGNALTRAFRCLWTLEHDVLKTYLRDRTRRPAFQRVVELGKA